MNKISLTSRGTLLTLLVSCSGSCVDGTLPAIPPVEDGQRPAHVAGGDLTSQGETIVALCDTPDPCRGERFPMDAITVAPGVVIASTRQGHGDHDAVMTTDSTGRVCSSSLTCTSLTTRAGGDIWCFARKELKCSEVGGTYAVSATRPSIAYSSDLGKTWSRTRLGSDVGDVVVDGSTDGSDVVFVGAGGQLWLALAQHDVGRIGLRRLGRPPPGNGGSDVALFSKDLICLKSTISSDEGPGRPGAALFCTRDRGLSWHRVERSAFARSASGPRSWWALEGDEQRRRLLAYDWTALSPRWVPVMGAASHGMLWPPTVRGGGNSEELIALAEANGKQAILRVGVTGRLLDSVPTGGLRITSLNASGDGIVVSAVEGVFLLDGRILRRDPHVCGLP
jgi:hypothetical protein